MTELTKVDMQFVLSRTPADIRKMLQAHPDELILAGGFIRSTVAGETVSDIDLFGSDAENLLRMAKDLTLERKGRYFTTKNAVTVLAPPRFPVQFITRWVFDNPLKCIQSFDFTVCQAAIWAERNATGVPTFKSAVSDEFYPDLAARRLTYTAPARVDSVGGSLLRVIKFVRRGYNIQAWSLAGIISRILAGVDTAAIARHEREDWENMTTRAITGLLREVDPLAVVDGMDFVDEHETVAKMETTNNEGVQS